MNGLAFLWQGHLWRIVTAIGFIFAVKSLQVSARSADLTAANAQAQLFNQMVMQGRDLQFKQIDLLCQDPAAAPSLKEQFENFAGIVLSYYSSCFELRSVLSMPGPVVRLQDAELKEVMRKPDFQKKMAELGSGFSSRFIQHVRDLEGVR
jgi:hypothetical protein